MNSLVHKETEEPVMDQESLDEIIDKYSDKQADQNSDKQESREN